MAGSSQRVPFAFDMLAEVAELGAEGRLADDLAHVSRRAEPQGATGLERGVHRRQFCNGEKGGDGIGKTKRGKGTKWMVLVDGQGLPLGARLESASPAKVMLAEATLKEVTVPLRERPAAAKAKARNRRCRIRIRSAARAVAEADHRVDRALLQEQQAEGYYDARKMRRYKRRWIVERTNARPGQFRRLLVHHQHLLSIYYAFFYIACFWITLRWCL